MSKSDEILATVDEGFSEVDGIVGDLQRLADQLADQAENGMSPSETSAVADAVSALVDRLRSTNAINPEPEPPAETPDA